MEEWKSYSKCLEEKNLPKQISKYFDCRWIRLFSNLGKYSSIWSQGTNFTTYCSTKTKKKLDVEKFLAPFDGLSNSKKTKIKKLFIEGIEKEIENRSLELKFQMIQTYESYKK